MQSAATTAKERLRWAIHNYGPRPTEGQTPERAFHRVLRAHTSGIVGSFYALKGYLDRARPIPQSYLRIAAKILSPVRFEWLFDGTEPVLENGNAPAAPLPVPTAPPVPAEAPQDLAPPDPDSPYADIRETVLSAGADPGPDALQALDPEYPRGGQSLRNWSLLFGVVALGYSPEDAPAGDLTVHEVRAIIDEYADLVRKVSGVPE